MKKQYISPNIKTIEIATETLLAASESSLGSYSYTWENAFGETAGKEDVASARDTKFNIWDEED